LLDLKLPDMTGIDVFRRAREVRPGIIVIMITAYSSVETAIEAMKMGAYDYITKPFNVEKLLMVAGNAIEARRRSQRASGSAARGAEAARQAADGARDEAVSDGGKPARASLDAAWALSGIDLRAEDEDFDGIVGVTARMRRLMEMSRDIAPTNATVLIYGESGTGKELVADYIHKKSLRAGGPCIKVNCAAIPEPLLESEPLDPLSVERIGAHSYQSHPGIEILLIAPYPCSSVFWRRILGAIEKAPCRLRRCDGSGNQG